MGTAPTLKTVTDTFGEKTTFIWLQIQIKDLSEFANCKDKLSVAQIENTARLIAHTCANLKLTEIMYFFLQFKSGKYGKFYSAVDGLVITTALQEFLKEYRPLKAKFLDEEAQEQRKFIEETLAKCKTFVWQTMKAELNGKEPNLDDFEKRCDEVIPNLIKLIE